MMPWLMILVMVFDGQPKLYLRATESEADCKKAIAIIRSTRPNEPYIGHCLDTSIQLGPVA